MPTRWANSPQSRLEGALTALRQLTTSGHASNALLIEIRWMAIGLNKCQVGSMRAPLKELEYRRVNQRSPAKHQHGDRDLTRRQVVGGYPFQGAGGQLPGPTAASRSD